MGPVAFGDIGPSDWGDRPLAIVGAGPSLRGFDLSRLRGSWRVLALKEMIFALPWADAGFGLDLPWMGRRKADLERSQMPVFLASDSGAHMHIERPAPRPGLIFIERRQGEGLSDDRAAVNSGGSSGFGALNLAYLKGARDIVLFGFDYGSVEGRHHYDDARYYWHISHSLWPSWAKRFDGTVAQLEAAGVTVTNACPNSRITAFPRVTIEEGLSLLGREAMQVVSC